MKDQKEIEALQSAVAALPQSASPEFVVTMISNTISLYDMEEIAPQLLVAALHMLAKMRAAVEEGNIEGLFNTIPQKNKLN